MARGTAGGVVGIIRIEPRMPCSSPQAHAGPCPPDGSLAAMLAFLVGPDSAHVEQDHKTLSASHRCTSRSRFASRTPRFEAVVAPASIRADLGSLAAELREVLALARRRTARACRL
jgi:hypothetical protein